MIHETLIQVDPRETDGAISRVVLAERVMLLAWPRAILLQLAHPLVAAGVAHHSRFDTSPAVKLKRLRHTIDAMLMLTFGTPEEAEAAAARINAIHDRVHGRASDAGGLFPRGAAYSAHNPELLRWVFATLLDSFILTYERFVGPLTDAEKDAFCAMARETERYFPVPTGFLPASRAELRRYMGGMVAGGEIGVTATARELAAEVLTNKLPLAIRPASRLGRLVTVGLLPSWAREQYGFAWTERQEAMLAFIARGARIALPLVPGALRYWPPARRAA